jgi:UDP-glucose 4-epimerase
MSRAEDTRAVAITGAAGFLGSTIVDKLSSAGRSVRCIDIVPVERPGVVSFLASVGDRAAMAKVLEGCETLIHLAWRGVEAVPPEGITQNVQDNLVSSLAMLEEARKLGVRRVVFASSGGTVYGVHEDQSLSESAACRPISTYGAAKLAFEALAHAFCHANGMTFLSLRVSNLYGPGQRGDKGQGLVAATVWRALKGEPVELWGDGSVVRDYVHVSDVADAFARATTYAGASNVVNIGSGTGRSVKEVVLSIERVLGRPVEVQWRVARRADVPRNVLNVSRARALLDWAAVTDFEAGVKSSVDWSRTVLGL